MSMFGQVFIKKNSYKIKGDFHRLSQNEPIRNADDGLRLMGVTNPRELTHIHTYGGEAPFFEALSKGRLLATRCDNKDCEYKGSVYQPFRIHCPDCLGRNTIIDMTEIARRTSRVHTFMICQRSGAFNTLGKPIKFINIEFDGVCTILMSYLSIGEPKFELKVVPIFNTLEPTYTILDLSWVPDGTPADKLPQGFTF
jgi:uncharacterized OB-fold protein